MGSELVAVALLTAAIHFVATLALSVRIVGVRTGLLALSGRISLSHFRTGVVQLAASRVAGVALGQVMLVPGAVAIVLVAKWL